MFGWPTLSFRGVAGTCRTRTRNLDLFSAKHSGIPGSRFGGIAAFARPGMTGMGWNDERALPYSSPSSRSSRRIGSGIASILAAALPRSGGASLSVR